MDPELVRALIHRLCNQLQYAVSTVEAAEHEAQRLPTGALLRESLAEGLAQLDRCIETTRQLQEVHTTLVGAGAGRDVR